MDELAGVLDRRLEAFLIDGILVVVAAAVLGYLAGTLFVGGQFGGLGGTILAVQFGSPLLVLGYLTAFEGYYGQTPGKSLRGIVVVNDDGTSVGWVGATVRNLLRIVDALPVFYIVGIIAAYASDDNQRLGDLAGSTVVVKTES